MTYEEAVKEFEPFIDHDAYTDSFQDACRLAIKALEKVADLEKRGFTDDVLDNYKTFEDECIAKGFTFKSLIEARERQIPKKPKNFDGYFHAYCPVCNVLLSMRLKEDFCFDCGQAIDWSDE